MAEIAALHPRVWRFCVVLTGRRDTAWDLSQSACTRAIEKLHTFRPGTELDRWLMTIARRVWLNEKRAESARGAGRQVDLDAVEIACEKPSAEANIFAGEVLAAVMALPETHRAAVLLVYVEGYSYREAADMLEVAIGTIMSRLAAARARIAGQMNEDAHRGAAVRT
ncbi:RNA polymerase sigma factor [Roseivivax halodurans]|nr:RNA polymerase sigma factor [Roseivivax halodurans]